MKKNKIFILFFLFFIFFYFVYIKISYPLNSKLYFLFSQIFSQELKNDKILFFECDFELKTFNQLLEKLKSAENSIILLLPQIFNIKFSDYLESINLEFIKEAKDDYNNFIFKIAELPNLLPLIFLYNEKNKKESIDLKKFSYLENFKNNFKKFNYIKINSKKLWYTVNNVGFFEEYNEHPFKISVFYNYNNYILLNGAVEAIRRYYKFPKGQIRFLNYKLNIGNIINFDLSEKGEIILKRYKKIQKIYSLDKIMNLTKEDLSDKIIIIKSNNISYQTMESLGFFINQLFANDFIKFNKNLDYFLLLILIIFLFFIFKEASVITNIIILFILIIFEIFLFIFLLTKNYFFDFSLYFFGILFTFFSINTIKIIEERNVFNTRKNLLLKYVDNKKIKEIITDNIDLKIKNSWLKTDVIYFILDGNLTPEIIKNSFEKIKSMLYNKIERCFIKILNFNELLVILLKEEELKRIIDLLLIIREEIKINFNILLLNTEVYFLEYNNEILIIDKNYNLKDEIKKIQMQKYVLIPERDLSKYMSLIKFQKIEVEQNYIFFNIISQR